MTPFQLTSIAAALAVASATAMAKQPDQRAIELAKSVADQSASQQPKAAPTQGNSSMFNALQTMLGSLVKKEGAQ
ncbi:MAG: hypothetical protein CVU22_05090 [Betaproteobacteria bacterium HGW-Betaproteobacteria-16]|nr:MAG: hypothetical protein CVU22_05090 [Betaproteobacteria bacterium HGW-Betaproteobacteria-16]